MSNIYERTFVFSQQQKDEIVKIETANGGSKPTFGTVVVRGVSKVYTEILTSGRTSRYADARNIITGDIRTITYTTPST